MARRDSVHLLQRQAGPWLVWRMIFDPKVMPHAFG
jgi:hypothetical protein